MSKIVRKEYGDKLVLPTESFLYYTKDRRKELLRIEMDWTVEVSDGTGCTHCIFGGRSLWF